MKENRKKQHISRDILMKDEQEKWSEISLRENGNVHLMMILVTL